MDSYGTTPIYFVLRSTSNQPYSAVVSYFVLASHAARIPNKYIVG